MYTSALKPQNHLFCLCFRPSLRAARIPIPDNFSAALRRLVGRLAPVPTMLIDVPVGHVVVESKWSLVWITINPWVNAKHECRWMIETINQFAHLQINSNVSCHNSSWTFTFVPLGNLQVPWNLSHLGSISFAGDHHSPPQLPHRSLERTRLSIGIAPAAMFTNLGMEYRTRGWFGDETHCRHNWVCHVLKFEEPQKNHGIRNEIELLKDGYWKKTWVPKFWEIPPLLQWAHHKFIHIASKLHTSPPTQAAKMQLGNSLKLTASSHLKIGWNPKRKGSFPNHPFFRCDFF